MTKTPPAVTVLVPTHDHAALIPFTLRSILRQSLADFEVFVVGDGAGPDTHLAVTAAANGDPRVRFFGFAKGERHGELNRHHALAEARGRIVAYCSDDDLWLDDHLANLRDGLANADFVHTLHTWVMPDGELAINPVDIATPEFRKVMTATKTNYFGPTVVGHTMAAYRALEVGWHPAPPGLWTDLHMWRKFFAADGLRFRSLPLVDTIHFPASLRRDWPTDRRLAELQGYAAMIETSAGAAAYRAKATASLLDKALVREKRAVRRRLVKAAVRGFARKVFRKP